MGGSLKFYGTKVSRSILVLTTLLVAGCGGASLQTGSGAQVQGTGPCTATLQASLQVMTDPASIIVGANVQLRASASFCQGSQFHIQGHPNSERFASFQDFFKTYSTIGVAQESYVIEAYDPSGSTLVATKSVSTSIVVNPAPTPNPPAGPALTSCSITRIANQLITKLDAPLSISLQVVGPYTSATLNGGAVQPGSPILLPPNVPGSGVYSATAEILNGAQKVTCAAVFQTPACTHSVVSAKVAGGPPEIVNVNSETLLYGPIAQVFVNGALASQLPVAPNNKLNFLTTIPYQPGQKISSAKVVSPLGDSTACQAAYTPQFSFSQTLSTIIPYLYALGFNPGNRFDTVVVGMGAAPQGTKMWTYRNATYAADVLDSDRNFVPRSVACGTNEVVVGRQMWFDLPTALSQLVCAPLRPELGLRNVSHTLMPWDYSVYGQCPAGKVLTGNIYTNGGIGNLGQLDLLCAEIYQK